MAKSEVFEWIRKLSKEDYRIFSREGTLNITKLINNLLNEKDTKIKQLEEENKRLSDIDTRYIKKYEDLEKEIEQYKSKSALGNLFGE